MTLRMVVLGGDAVPKGYGIAWREFDRDFAICYRWPLNILLGGLRRVWFAIRWFRWGQSAYERGYTSGRLDTRQIDYNRGFDAGRLTGIREGAVIADGAITELLQRVVRFTTT